MLFSVVIPAYNSESFIAECLDSLVSQSFQDWEAIVVDDGSVDSTVSVIERSFAGEPRIRVMRKNNAGPLLARRDGIAASSGDYILFLDSDDCFISGALQQLNEILSLYHPDIVMFPANVLGASGELLRHVGEYASGSGWVDKRALYREVFSSHSYNSMCLKAFKASLLKSDGLDYDSCAHIRFGEDKVQTLSPLTEAESVFYYPHSLYDYRYRQRRSKGPFDIASASTMVSNGMFELLLGYRERWEIGDIDPFLAYYARHFMSVCLGSFRSIRNPSDIAAFFAVDWNGLFVRHDQRCFSPRGLKLLDRAKLLFILYLTKVVRGVFGLR